MIIKTVKKTNPLAASFAATPSLVEEIEYKKLTIIEELLRYLKSEGISRTELADRMGVAPSRITKLLNGAENLTIGTLVRAGKAVGADLQQTFVPQGQYGHWMRATRIRSTGDKCISLELTPTKVEQAPTPKLDRKKPATYDAEDAA